jgi:hypothetical protein
MTIAIYGDAQYDEAQPDDGDGTRERTSGI